MSNLKELMVKFYNESQRKGHEEFLNDAEHLERMRSYNWWTPDREEYPDPLHINDFSWSEVVYDLDSGSVEIDGYTLKHIERVGGEGEGDHIHWVFSITDPDDNEVYWRIDGYWVSHDGAYWDEYDPYQVTPKTRTVTYYE